MHYSIDEKTFLNYKKVLTSCSDFAGFKRLFD